MTATTTAATTTAATTAAATAAVTSTPVCPARSDVEVAALREALTRRLEDPTGWSAAEWVEVGDLVADLAAVDQGRETLRVAFTWARRRPATDVVASPAACEVLWALLNTPGASLPLTISQTSQTSQTSQASLAS